MEDVVEGVAGVVEVSVVRNAFAHGDLEVRKKDVNRLGAVGITTVAEGDGLQLSYEGVRRFRQRLLSLMRNGGVGS